MNRRFVLNLAAVALSLIFLAGITSAILRPNPVTIAPDIDLSATPSPITELVGRGWILAALNPQPRFGQSWFLIFKSDGTFSGSGCGDYHGHYSVDGNRLTITFEVEPQLCLHNLAAAGQYRDVLAGTHIFSIIPDQELILADANGNPVAFFNFLAHYGEDHTLVPSATIPAAPTMTMTPVGPLPFGIVVGHRGTEDQGYTCADGLAEYTVVGAVAAQLAPLLEAQGYPAIVFKQNDARLDGFSGTALLELHTGSCDAQARTSGFDIVASGPASVNSWSWGALCIIDVYGENTGLSRLAEFASDHGNFSSFFAISSETPALAMEIGALGADRTLLEDTTRIAEALANALIFCAQAAAQPTATPAENATPTPTILDYSGVTFISNKDGDFELYTMLLGSREITQLTFNNAVDQKPVGSPDYRHIAFTSDRTGTDQLYLMNRDGSDQVQLTDNPAVIVTTFAWSPRADNIAFLGFEGVYINLYVINLNTREVRKLAEQVVMSYPSWSPDGTQIAFAAYTAVGISGDLSVVDVASGVITPLSTGDVQAMHPIWLSNTNPYFVFDARVGNGDSAGLFHYANGSITDLNTDPSPDLYGLSPDRKWLVYGHALPTNSLYIIDPYSGAGRSVDLPHDFPSGVAWSPQSDYLIVSLSALKTDGQPGTPPAGLYLVNLADLSVTLLFEDGFANIMPTWLP